MSNFRIERTSSPAEFVEYRDGKYLASKNMRDAAKSYGNSFDIDLRNNVTGKPNSSPYAWWQFGLFHVRDVGDYEVTISGSEPEIPEDLVAIQSYGDIVEEEELTGDSSKREHFERLAIGTSPRAKFAKKVLRNEQLH